MSAPSRAVAGWAGSVSVEDLAPVEARLGRSGVAGHRIRPDGHDLRWRQIGVNDLRAEPSLPFFTCWEGDGTDHPSTGGADGPRLACCRSAGSPERVVDWLGASPEDSCSTGSPSTGSRTRSPGLVAVTFDTAHGPVTHRLISESVPPAQRHDSHPHGRRGPRSHRRKHHAARGQGRRRPHRQGARLPRDDPRPRPRTG